MFEPFGWEIDIVFVTDVAGYARRFKYAHKADWEAFACTDYEKRKTTIVLPWDVSAGVVAHEAYHCVVACLQACAVVDEEAAAYHLQYLVEEIGDFWRERKKKRRFFISK